jgi:hypothetical protein
MKNFERPNAVDDPDYPGGIGRPVWDWGTPQEIAMRRPGPHPGRAIAFFFIIGAIGWTSFLWVPLLIVKIAMLLGSE